MRERLTLEKLLDVLISPSILISHDIESYNGGCHTVTTICPKKLRLAIYGAPPKSELVSAKGMTEYELECQHPGYDVIINHEGRFATITEIIEFN